MDVWQVQKVKNTVYITAYTYGLNPQRNAKCYTTLNMRNYLAPWDTEFLMRQWSVGHRTILQGSSVNKSAFCPVSYSAVDRVVQIPFYSLHLSHCTMGHRLVEDRHIKDSSIVRVWKLPQDSLSVERGEGFLREVNTLAQS